MNPAERSPYYPPRATGSARRRRAWYRFRRRLQIERLQHLLRSDLTALLVAFVVPLFGWYYVRGRYWGHRVTALYAALGLLFFWGLGHLIANLAFGLLVAIHGVGCILIWEKFSASETFGRRLARAWAVLFLVAAVFYWPLRAVITRHFFIPLDTPQGVRIVSPSFPPGSVRRGDWIAYHLRARGAGGYENGVIVQAGLDFQEVRGLPGDVVRFGPAVYTVNGIAHPRLAGMPTYGVWQVPKNDWFIWPRLAHLGHGTTRQDVIDAMMQQLALVPQSAYIGRAFGSWFGRKLKSP